MTIRPAEVQEAAVAAKKTKIARITLENMDGTQFAIACTDLMNAERNVPSVIPRRADALLPTVKALVADVRTLSKAVGDEDRTILHEKHATAMLSAMERCMELSRGVIDRKDKEKPLTCDNRHLGYMSGLMGRVLQFGKVLERMLPPDSPEAERVKAISSCASELATYNPRQLRTSSISIPHELCDRLDTLCEKIALARESKGRAH